MIIPSGDAPKSDTETGIFNLPFAVQKGIGFNFDIALRIPDRCAQKK